MTFAYSAEIITDRPPPEKEIVIVLLDNGVRTRAYIDTGMWRTEIVLPQDVRVVGWMEREKKDA